MRSFFFILNQAVHTVVSSVTVHVRVQQLSWLHGYSCQWSHAWRSANGITSSREHIFKVCVILHWKQVAFPLQRPMGLCRFQKLLSCTLQIIKSNALPPW